MDLSIIIVNYNAAKFIAQCIQSILQQTSAISFEIIVVDNKSTDDSKMVILQQFPIVKWIDMEYNAGFARANNAGINQSLANTVLLLNPDTIIIENAIEKCYRQFTDAEEIACSAQLINPDGTAQITGNFFMTGGLNHLLPLPYLGKFLRSVAFAFKAKKTNIVQAGDREEVDWINGAFLMVKKYAIEKAGLMDEDFFLYAEEAEWCYRLKQAGKLVVYGNLKVIHLQGEIANKEFSSFDKGYFNLYDKKGFQLIASNSLRIRKQCGWYWFLFHLTVYTIECPLFAVLNLIDNIFHFKMPFQDCNLIKGYCTNITKLWMLVPTILFSKNYFYKFL